MNKIDIQYFLDPLGRPARFIWNPLPNMIIYDNVLSNVQSMIVNGWTKGQNKFFDLI